MNWHNFNWMDWALLGLFLVSIGFSVVRGFVRETLSLAIWALASLNAYLLGDELASMLADWVNKPSLRLTAGMAILFVMTLLVGALLSYVLSEVVKNSGLTVADRILGTFFGAARAVIIILMFVLFVPPSMKQSKGWQQSQLLPHFESWEVESRKTVQSIGAYIHRTLT